MVTKMIQLLGSFVVGSIGWWLGMKVGVTTAVMLSAVGTGVGVYAGRRIAARYDLP